MDIFFFFFKFYLLDHTSNLSMWFYFTSIAEYITNSRHGKSQVHLPSKTVIA